MASTDPARTASRCCSCTPRTSAGPLSSWSRLEPVGLRPRAETPAVNSIRPGPGSAPSLTSGPPDALFRPHSACIAQGPTAMADAKLHRYRSHTCGALRATDIDGSVRLSGWVHRVRDHGGLLFIDLRDHYGITQVVADPDSPAFKTAESARSEWVIRVDGKVRARPMIDGKSTVNKELATGEIEVEATEIEVLSQARELPVPVFGEPDYPEDLRLTYRFLDLRRQTLHAIIMKRLEI